MPKLASGLLYKVYAVRLAVSPNAKISRMGQNSPTVLSRFWTKVHQISAACRVLHSLSIFGSMSRSETTSKNRQQIESVVCPCRLTSSFRLLISCSAAEICSVKIQSWSPKAFFAPSPRGKCPGSSDQIFQIAVIN